MATKAIPFYVIERDTYSTVKRVVPEGKTTCALCSRLRRGTLYGFAEANGVTKIALGIIVMTLLKLFSEFILRVENENDATQVSLR